jgi:hypothetical protein
MKRDGLDDFIHHAVPPVQVSAQRVERTIHAVMQRLDARAVCAPVHVPMGLSPMAMISRFVMPVAFGAILGILSVDLSPVAPSAWGVSSLVASAYYLPGNY